MLYLDLSLLLLLSFLPAPRIRFRSSDTYKFTYLAFAVWMQRSKSLKNLPVNVFGRKRNDFVSRIHFSSQVYSFALPLACAYGSSTRSRQLKLPI